ncbi:MAG: hypothetical protein WAR76_07385, partial [Xanthobacteraceae bacterium]
AAGERPSASRWHAAAKRLQSKDLFLNRGRNKRQSAPRRRLLLVYSAALRTAKPWPAVGVLPGRRLRLR